MAGFHIEAQLLDEKGWFLDSVWRVRKKALAIEPVSYVARDIVVSRADSAVFG